MAPAPKSRVPKGEVFPTENPIVASNDENLIDLDDGDKNPKPQALRRNATDVPAVNFNGSRSDLGASPKSASYLRRTSSLAGASDHEGPPKRSSTAELREHLKHLGPSNLASRPRQTRYNTVKIKPGDGSISEGASKVLSTSAAPQGGVGAGLLNSAGKDAKDGVQAVQAGYGSMGTTPISIKKDDQGFPFDVANLPSEQTQETDKNNQISSNQSQENHSNSHSTLGSLDGGFQSKKSPKYNSVARSGSITENIIDAGGIKKTVLELTSSSSEDVENRTAEDNEEEDDNQVQLEDGDSRGSANDGKGNNAKGEGGKKKRRRKKKKGSKSNENTPLLER